MNNIDRIVTWDQYFCNLLEPVSTKSKDPNTKTSAIIVGPDHEIRSTGFNGFPRRLKEDYSNSLRWVKPEKYIWVEHAERNAIYNAARMGISLNDCIMYCSHFPCVECGRAIVQSGIVRVIIDNKNLNAFKGKDSIYLQHEQIVREMFEECGVELNIFGS
jgi:dCMP deaminase